LKFAQDLLKRARYGFRNQLILRSEMLVETAVCQSRGLHHPGQSTSRNAIRANFFGGGI
jgi:hypothetical protein